MRILFIYCRFALELLCLKFFNIFVGLKEFLPFPNMHCEHVTAEKRLISAYTFMNNCYNIFTVIKWTFVGIQIIFSCLFKYKSVLFLGAFGVDVNCNDNFNSNKCDEKRPNGKNEF